MKRGTLVAVCHDGKWGRRVQGEVVGTRNGHHILVRFPNPEDGTNVEFWARLNRPIRKRRVRETEYYIAVQPKRPKYFSGWADIDYFCPWFAVYPWPTNTKDE